MTQQQRIWAVMALLCLGGIVFYFFFQKQATQKHLRNYYQLHLQHEDSFRLLSTSISNTMNAFQAKVEKERRGEEFLKRSARIRELCARTYEQIGKLQNEMAKDEKVERDITLKPMKKVARKILFQEEGLIKIQPHIDTIFLFISLLDTADRRLMQHSELMQKFRRDSLKRLNHTSSALENHFKGLSVAATYANLSSLILAIQNTEKMVVDIHFGKVGEKTILFDRTPSSQASNNRGYAKARSTIAHNFTNEKYANIHENGFLKVENKALSTFSIDVDGASYSNIRRFLNRGSMPPQDAVRIEEMILDFGRKRG